MTKSTDLLKEAMTGEFNATRRYTKFAEIAKNENLTNIARLFRAAAAAERIHLLNHGRALGEEFKPAEKDFKIGITIENLQDAILGEKTENEEMYPDFLKAIKKELKTDKGQLASLSMIWANKVEKNHMILFAEALESVKLKQDWKVQDVWLCIVCGNIFTEKNKGELCEICGHDSKFYRLIEV
jgi:rubrerythrin